MSMVSLLLLALFLGATVVAVESESLTLRPGCQASCGGVKVPYPFGIGTDCFRPGFEIACVNKTPVLTGTTQVIQVLELSVMPRPEARVMLPVAWQCFNTTTDVVFESFDGRLNINPTGVYRISNTSNELFVLGCNTFIYTNSGPPGRYKNSYYAGCITFCNDSRSAQDGACAGIGCCHVDIPPGLTDNWMRFYTFTHVGMDFSPCDFAFIVEKGYYSFQEADLHMGPGASHRKMPMRLDWAIRDSNVNSTASLTCSQAANRPGYTCVSDHSECFDSINGPGYFCNCTEGYDGNPYLHKGCTNINECERNYSCNGICHDTEGSYSCICHSGYESIGDPKKFPCTSKFPFAARLALGIGLGVFFLVFSLLLAFIMHQKRILAKNFDMNGGNILKKATGLDIFTEKDLHKITKNNSDPLGKGYFGEVYKGTLSDEANTTVAVKSFLKVDKERIEEFTEEVMIQVKMNHANVLKLMGCCLQLDVPMLVYEFAAKGSLRDILHGNIKQKLTAELRLDIAIGSAEGLSYMHFQEIRHGDVKPDNILLNEKSIPKISDFGLSKLLKLGDKIAKKVIGCEGYMDPVFRNTGELTPKSDVYSFGVVLLELISRKQITYGQSGSLIIEFRHIYETEKSGRSMFDKEIETEEDTLILEEIGKLAMRCLKERLDARPDMTEVTKQLVKLRKNTANDAATFEMSGTTYARLSVPPSPISETSKLIHSQTMHQVGVRR